MRRLIALFSILALVGLAGCSDPVSPADCSGTPGGSNNGCAVSLTGTPGGSNN